MIDDNGDDMDELDIYDMPNAKLKKFKSQQLPRERKSKKKDTKS